MSDNQFPDEGYDDVFAEIADKENSNPALSGQRPLSVTNSLAHQAGSDQRVLNFSTRKPLEPLPLAVAGKKRERSPPPKAEAFSKNSSTGKRKAKVEVRVPVPGNVLAEVATSLKWVDLCPNGWGNLDNGKKVAWLRSTCSRNPELAKLVLWGYYQKTGAFAPTFTELGCVQLPYEPTKSGGYSQLSFQGANKFAEIQEITCWASGDCKSRHMGVKNPQCSHLCPSKNCARIAHIIIESAEDNNDRKGCPGWITCGHADGKIIWVCWHTPCCITQVHPDFGIVTDKTVALAGAWICQDHSPVYAKMMAARKPS